MKQLQNSLTDAAIGKFKAKEGAISWYSISEYLNKDKRPGYRIGNPDTSIGMGKQSATLSDGSFAILHTTTRRQRRRRQYPILK